MITIIFKEKELYDESTNRFVELPEKKVSFEYSLRAISKWESKWKVPFLSSTFKPNDPKLLDFYCCMADDDTFIAEYLDDRVALTLDHLMHDSHTATTFMSQNESNSKGAKQVFTSEVIYAMMFMSGIPLDFENRNLNQLLTILRVISHYTNPPKKMTKEEVLRQNARINAERKAKYKTRG